MIKRILVGTDGSRYAEGAGHYAVWAARAYGAALTACYILDIRLLDGPFFARLAGMLGFAPATDFRANAEPVLRGLGETALGFIAELARHQGVSCEEVIASGPVASTLAEKARTAQLVVIGRQGDHAEYENDMLGGVAEGVLKRVPHPVLLAPADFEKPRRAVILYDDQPSADEALALGLGLPERYGLHLIIDAARRPAVEKTLASYARTATFEDFPAALEDRVADLDPSDLVFLGAHGPSDQMLLAPRTQLVIRAATGPLVITA